MILDFDVPVKYVAQFLLFSVLTYFIYVWENMGRTYYLGATGGTRLAIMICYQIIFLIN